MLLPMGGYGYSDMYIIIIFYVELRYRIVCFYAFLIGCMYSFCHENLVLFGFLFRLIISTYQLYMPHIVYQFKIYVLVKTC